MAKFKRAFDAIADFAVEMHEQNEEIEKMTYELLRRTGDLDRPMAKRIATLLVTQADVTWK